MAMEIEPRVPLPAAKPGVARSPAVTGAHAVKPARTRRDSGEEPPRRPAADQNRSQEEPPATTPPDHASDDHPDQHPGGIDEYA